MAPSPSVTWYANGGVFSNGSDSIYIDSMDMTGSRTIEFNLQINNAIPTRQGYILIGWSTTSAGTVEYMMSDVMSDLVSDGVTGGVYAVWKLDPTTKCIFEKGAVDIIVDNIKNGKSGPTISASGDTLTITN